MSETRRHQDPYGRINGDPPEGMSWTIVEHPSNDLSWLRQSHRESTQLCSVEGPPRETQEEKKIRLLREASALLACGLANEGTIRDLRDAQRALDEVLKMETE